MATPLSPELWIQLHRIVHTLTTEFEGVFSKETIARYAEESADLLVRDATVQLFIPLFVERFSRERLRALAQAESRMDTEVPEVLFICLRNAGRSQMAAALLNHQAQGKAHARSAGTAPGERVNPAAVAAMAELGLDLAGEFPRPLTDEVLAAAEVVITMGCGDACPLLPGKRYLDWNVADPAGQSVVDVRPIRDELERRVRALLDTLGMAR